MDGSTPPGDWITTDEPGGTTTVDPDCTSREVPGAAWITTGVDGDG